MSDPGVDFRVPGFFRPRFALRTTVVFCLTSRLGIVPVATTILWAVGFVSAPRDPGFQVAYWIFMFTLVICVQLLVGAFYFYVHLLNARRLIGGSRIYATVVDSYLVVTEEQAQRVSILIDEGFRIKNRMGVVTLLDGRRVVSIQPAELFSAQFCREVLSGAKEA